MGYIIDLAEYQEINVNTLLIVPMASPATYTTQAGGVQCAHPKLTGVLVPLIVDEDFDMAGELHDSWFTLKDDPAELTRSYLAQAPLLRRLLKRSGLDGILEPLADLDAYKEWGEAWVPVRIKEDPDPGAMNYTAIKTLKGALAILTYQNSD